LRAQREVEALTRRTWLTEVAAVLVLCALGGWLWQARIMGPKTVPMSLLNGADQYTYFYPMHRLVAERLAAGEWPLWNPWQLAGLPLLATLQTAVFYPPNLLHLLLSTEGAMEALALFHLLLAGMLAYALARTLGARPVAALVAGLAYPWSSFLVDSHLWASSVAVLALFPLPLLGLARIHRGHGVGGCSLLALGLALLILAGYPSFAVYGLHVATLYALWNGARTLATRGIRSLIREGAWIALGGLLAILLAAPQWVPTLELAELATRSTGGLTSWQMEPMGVVPLSQWRGLFTPGVVWGGYVGILSLLLLPAGLLSPRHRSESAFFLGIGLFAALVAVGSAAPFFELYKYLPGAKLFRFPGRALCLFVLCAAQAASLGAESLLAPVPARCARRWALMAAILAVGAGLVASGLPYSRGMILLACLVLAPVAFLPSRWGVGAALVSVGLLFFTLFSGTGEKPPQIWRKDELKQLWKLDQLYQRLRSDLGLQRGLVSMSLIDYAATSPKMASLMWVYLFQDYEPLTPRRYADYASFIQNGDLYNDRASVQPYTGQLDLRKPLAHPRLLAVAGVAVVASVDRVEGGTILIRLDNIQRALPRAYIVHGVRAAADAFTTLRQLAEGTVDPAAQVILESPPLQSLRPPSRVLPGEYARILRYAPEAVYLEVSLRTPGALVLLDADYPGWKATVDGHDVRIYNANYLFRGLVLPSGTHRVAFRYEPLSFRIGLTLGSLGSLGLALLLLFPITRKGGLKGFFLRPLRDTSSECSAQEKGLQTPRG